MKIFLVFFLFLIFLFSGRLIAGNCFTIDNSYEITFSGNGNNNCLSDDGLSIYYSAKVGNIGFIRSNGKGFSLSLTFDRDYGNISVGNEVVLFGAYADIDGTESLLEIGINSVNNIFVKRPDQKINIDVVGDDDLTSPHSLVLSYNERSKQLILTIDGADAIEDNVDSISTEIKKIIIGKNFKGKIAPVYGFSDRLDQIDRFNEADRLSVVYKVPISPLRKVAGILVSRRLCTSTQVKSSGINECVSITEAFPTQLSVGMNTPPGSSLTKSGTFPLVCDPGFSPSDPAPTYTVDSNGTVISVDGSCNPEDCNITGQAGIANPTNVSYGTGTLQCLTLLGYKDSISYDCGSGGVVNITSEPCNLMNESEAVDYIANNANPGDDFTNMIEAIPNFDSSDVETYLGSNSNYSCAIIGVTGIDDQDINYGTTSIACSGLSAYIGSIDFNCDQSGTASIGGGSCTIMNEAQAQDFITNYASPGDDLSAFVSNSILSADQINTSLASNTNYECIITAEPGIIDGTIIDFGLETLNCVGLLGYTGEAQLDCQDGNIVVVNTSCTPMDDDSAISFLTNDIMPGDDISAIAGDLDQDTINSALASNSNFNCDVSTYPTPNFFSNISLPITYGSGQSFACDVGFIGSGISEIDCTSANAIDLSTGGDCTARTYKVDIDFTLPANSTDPGDITYDVLFLIDGFDTTTINNGVICNNGYESSDGDADNLIRYRFNSSSNADIILKPDVICNPKTYTAVTENPGDFEYILPDNVVDLVITYDESITTSSPADFTCDTGYVANDSSPNYYFDGISLITSGGICIGQTYEAVTDYVVPSNSVDISPIPYNADATSASPINFTCSPGYEAHSDGSPHYYFTESEIIIAGGSCIAKTYTAVTENPGDFEYILPDNVVDLVITYDASITTSSPADFTCDTGYVANDSSPNYYFDGISLITSGGICIGQTYEAVTDYVVPSNSVDISPITYNADATSASPINFTCSPGYEAHSDGSPHYYFTESEIIIAGGSCIAKTYNVGATGTDLVVANTINTNITYNPIYSGTLTPDNIGLTCNVGYEPSDNNVNGLIQYKFNTSTGDVEMETTASCIAKIYNVGATGTDLVVTNTINTNITYNPTYSGTLTPDNIGLTCNVGYEPSDNNVNGLIQYQFNTSTGDVEMETTESCIAKTYNVGATGTDLVVANSTNTTITYNPDYDVAIGGSLSPENSGIDCSGTYGPSDNNVNGLIQYQFNNGEIEIEYGVTCIPAQVTVSTFATGITDPFGITTSGNNLYVGNSFNGYVKIKRYDISSQSYLGEYGSRALKIVRQMVADSAGNLYIATVYGPDYHYIIKIDTEGQNSNFMGNGGGGTGTTAMQNPFAVTLYNNDIYAINSHSGVGYPIRKKSVNSDAGSSGMTHVSASGCSAGSLAADNSGNIYILCHNHTIRKIDSGTDNATTFAGTSNSTGSNDGALLNAKFNFDKTGSEWNHINGMVYHPGHNALYIADGGNHLIRKIDLSTNQVSTIAGTAGTTGSTDGQGLSQAKFNKPGGITVDSNGNLYVSDNENNSIRKLSW